MIQGWRPTSVTTQPASIATIPSGLAQQGPRGGTTRLSGMAFRSARPSARPSRARPIIAIPQATMIWNAGMDDPDVGGGPPA